MIHITKKMPMLPEWVAYESKKPVLNWLLSYHKYNLFPSFYYLLADLTAFLFSTCDP